MNPFNLHSRGYAGRTYFGYFTDQIALSDGDGAYDRYPSAIEVPWNYYEGCDAFHPEHVKPERVVHDTLSFLYQVLSTEILAIVGFITCSILLGIHTQHCY